MTSFVSGMDKHTMKQTGENAHTEYSISNELDEKICQFFFQLVRTEDHSALQKLHTDIITSIKGDPERLMMMYKLAHQTRDIISGKGEQQLGFMQLYNFYVNGFEQLAINGIKHYVYREDEQHPFGSWKDIKYWCNYVKEHSNDDDHPLINVAIDIAIEQLVKDFNTYENMQVDNGISGGESKSEPGNITLVAKWLTREKSKKYGWIFKKMATKVFPDFVKTAKNSDSKRRAVIKSRIKLNDMLVKLTKYLDVTQVKQCGRKWNEIDFNRVTSATMRKQTLAFTYKDKKGNVRGNNEDRLQCSSNFKEHISQAKSGSTNHKVHGRRVNVYELVKDAVTTGEFNSEKIDTINLQWIDNMKNNGGLGKIIPCSDTSYSMTVDENIPLYNSIGLGIRVSELTHPAFRDRVLSFAANPVWHNLSTCETFVEKAKKVHSMSTGLNTNFYKALKMILDVLIENEVPPEEAEGMVLAIFSDMQIDSAICIDHEKSTPPELRKAGVNYMDTLYDCIVKLYAEAGMRSSFKRPYSPPHILFWNLRKTNGFPVLSTQKNTSMLSGYSSALLNILCEKGIDELKEFTPRRMIKDMLSNERYTILEEDVKEYFVSHS